MSLQVCLSIVGLVAALIIIGELKFHRQELKAKEIARMMEPGNL